jgi:hypothetical protein
MGRVRDFSARLGQFMLQAVSVLVLLAILVAIFRILWVIGSSPTIAATFVKADFVQAMAAIFTGAATIALWVVTRRLTRVTKVQVHATTAPLIFSYLYIRHEPPVDDAESKLPLPAYEWAAEDAAYPDVNAFHKEHDAKVQEYEFAHKSWEILSSRYEAPAVALSESEKTQEHYRAALMTAGQPSEPERPASTYIVLVLGNAQAQSSYGFATDIEIDVLLKFPRYSTVKGATGTTVPSADNFFELPRTLKVNTLFGQGSYSFAAFRVDEMPIWEISVASIRYKNFLGDSKTFAIGTTRGMFSVADGFKAQQGRWAAMNGELPK